jgi:predicted amidohydrolase YtcJ
MTVATAFLGGRVFTGRRFCSALLVEDGDVEVVGSDAEVRRASPTGTEFRALNGEVVLPGLIDAHVHIAATTRKREGLDLSGAASIDLVGAAVRAWGEAHPHGPIVAYGLDPERFPGAAWPTRSDLDRIEGVRPLVLVHASGHAMLANSVVLRGANVDRSTPDPGGGRFGRDSDGVPDGRVFESAIGLLESRWPDLDRVEPDAMLRTLRATAALGLTTLGAMSVDPGEATTLRQLADSEQWSGRVRVYLRGDRWRDYFRDPGGPSGPGGRFEVVGVKAFTDGAFGTRTALLSEPYSDDPSTHGLAVGNDAELGDLIASATHQGLAPALHAIGDRAIVRALGLLRGLRMPNRRRPRIEHAALTPPTLLPALGELTPAMVVQPGFVWSDHWLAARLGPERARWAYAFRTLHDREVLLVGSSDAPYDPLDPWRGLRAAVQRTDSEGRSANPEPTEALDAPTAVQLYTTNAGVALGEPLLGLLEPGAPADLVWTRARSLDAAISAGAAVVRETWVAGERLAVGPGQQG